MNHKLLRQVLAALAAFVPVISLSISTWLINSKLSPGQNVVNLDVFVQKSLDISLETMRSTASLTIALTGSIWGLLIIGKDKVRLRLIDWFFFAAGSLSLGISYWAFHIANERVIESLFKAKTIDLASPVISFWRDLQLYYFVLGFCEFLMLSLVLYFKKGGIHDKKAK